MVIIGGSIVKITDALELLPVSSVRTRGHPGETIEDLIDYIKPIFLENLTQLIHILTAMAYEIQNTS